MAFDMQETPDSGATTIQPPSIELRYVTTGESDPSVVQSLVLSATPYIMYTTVGTLYRGDVKVDPQGGQVCKVAVPYGTDKHQTGSYSFNFDTTGASIKVKCAKAHVQTYYPSGSSGAANPHLGSIGVTQDGKIEGCDVAIPAFKLNVTYRAPQGVVTLGYARSLASVTGYYNTDTFLIFQPGELLFLGATGSDGTEAESEVNYQFVASQNATGLTIGQISGIAKNGHDYAWVEFADAVGSDGIAAQVPLRVHVERVYDGISFTDTFGWGG